MDYTEKSNAYTLCGLDSTPQHSFGEMQGARVISWTQWTTVGLTADRGSAVELSRSKM